MKPAPVHLTPRQREVLTLLCEGLSNKLICRRLDISKQTVKVHISAILRELGVTSRLQAVVAAHHHGLITASGSMPASAQEPAREGYSARAPSAAGNAEPHGLVATF